jgi:predicted O-linked N-acetylglucosamine transferase (SPINDLY family)
MDVYLDCPAFSGYTTAWQAIHRGLPIITLQGRYLRQRLASGLLRQIGRDDQIAGSHESYLQIALRLSSEILTGADRGAARRDAIRRAASRTDDGVSVLRVFERTIIDMTRPSGALDASPG